MDGPRRSRRQRSGLDRRRRQRRNLDAGIAGDGPPRRISVASAGCGPDAAWPDRPADLAAAAVTVEPGAGAQACRSVGGADDVEPPIEARRPARRIAGTLAGAPRPRPGATVRTGAKAGRRYCEGKAILVFARGGEVKRPLSR